MYPFSLTLKSLSKANLIRIMLACAALAFFVIVGLTIAITWAAAVLVNFKTGWLDTTFNWLVGLVTGVGGWFMLPALTVLIGGIFQESVIFRVEKAFYPDVVRAEPPKLWPDLTHDIKFTIKALALNILILPLYFFAIGVVASIILNSYLLGREFFEGAAGYHLGKANARELGKQHAKAVYGGGLVITLMTLTPILNMFVPVIATVWMVHVYHKLKAPT